MLKVATIGGGSSYTPELVEGFIKRYDRFPIDELWLVDIEDGREKVEIVGALAQRMFIEAGLKTKVIVSFDRREAIKGANFVTTQLRVGLLQARAKDERIPNELGLLGQETNGPGGHFKSLRTIPVILDIVKDVEELAPDAWIINFANPAGAVSEAINRHTNFKRFIGVCNVPFGMRFGLAEQLNVKPEELDLHFLGLNHMVFITKAFLNGEDITEKCIELSLSSSMNNIHDIPWNKKFVRGLGVIPCPYHRYFYKYKEMMEHQIEDFKGNVTRAEVVMKLEDTLFEKYKDVELKVKPKELEKRGGAHYSDVACDVVASIYNSDNNVHVVNVNNNGHIKNIGVNDTIEVTCTINANGAIIHPDITQMPEQIKGIYELFKSYEKKTTDAVINKSKKEALSALMMNPFIQSDDLTEEVFDNLYEAHLQYVDYLK